MIEKNKDHVNGEKFSKPDVSSSIASNHNSPNANPSRGDPPDPNPNPPGNDPLPPPDPPEKEPLPPNEEGLDPDRDKDKDEDDDRDVDSPIDDL